MVIAPSTQSLEMKDIPVMRYTGIPLFYFMFCSDLHYHSQVATDLCAFPSGLQKDKHREVHRKNMGWAGECFMQLSGWHKLRCDGCAVTMVLGQPVLEAE